MRDNVVSLFANKQANEETTSDPSMEFINTYLIPWAVENYIDVNSKAFIINASAIMTVLQGMLLENDF